MPRADILTGIQVYFNSKTLGKLTKLAEERKVHPRHLVKKYTYWGLIIDDPEAQIILRKPGQEDKILDLK